MITIVLVIGLGLVVGSMGLIKVGSPSSQRRRYIRVAEGWKCAAAPTT